MQNGLGSTGCRNVSLALLHIFKLQSLLTGELYLSRNFQVQHCLLSLKPSPMLCLKYYSVCMCSTFL